LKHWRNLTLQLFITTVLPMTVLLLVIAFGSMGLHQRAMRLMVGERDERATRAAAAAITEQLRYRQSAVRSVALQAATASTPEQALAEAAFLLPDFTGGLALYTLDGALLASSNGRETWQARTIPERLHPFSASLTGQEALFIPHFTDPASGETLMLVAATAGDIVALGAFPPAELARRALANIFGHHEQATAYVVASDGDILYQIGQPIWPDTPPTEHPGAADALRGESGATYLTQNGTEYVITFSPVLPVDWALVIGESWYGVSHPLLRATELAPLILISVLIVALIALWFGVRQVVQPLQSLARQATGLGWGDFAALEKPVGGINEIQRLQTELIHMARKVKMAQQSLRGYLGAITTGQEEERRRLARDLHDDTIQSLIALNQQIQLAQLTAPNEASLARLTTMQQMAEQTIADLRRLTRDLRPIYLEDLGLIPALAMLAQEVSRATGLPISFTTVGEERRLSPDVELALYRIAQEGLSNVARHAQAKQAEVCLHLTAEGVRLTVQDDGLGFVAPESPAEMAPAGHFGLLGVQERAEAVGARLQIETAPGKGARLTVSLDSR
jgi:signal transduction histidine kinase